jgi:MarR family transcriptional regulator, organic hydroperoxide resistance regulator
MSTLTRKGLVESTVGSVDRRITLLSLTSAGVDTARTVSQIEQSFYGAVTLIVDDDHVKDALPALRALVGSLPAGRALPRRIADGVHAQAEADQ